MTNCPEFTQNDVARLLAHTNRELGPSGCWIWMASKTPFGYGKFSISRKYITAHRASFLFFRGPIANHMCVCHSCDNPSCVNPSHLWLGTNLENVKDRHLKGRDAKGETHVSRTMPERVPRGIRHGSATSPGRLPKGENHWTNKDREKATEVSRKHAKLSKDLVAAIREKYAQGDITYRELAAENSINEQTVYRLVKRISWQ